MAKEKDLDACTVIGWTPFFRGDLSVGLELELIRDEQHLDALDEGAEPDKVRILLTVEQADLLGRVLGASVRKVSAKPDVKPN
jgi:hypothetical protein